MKPIYLDYNATTPIDPRVLEAMLPFLQEHFGNPSSSHAYGIAAHHAVDQSRQQVADLINAKPGEIVFTGGGSEASNMAIKGVLSRQSNRFSRSHLAELSIITSAIEHPATEKPCQYLQEMGCQVHVVPVDRHGMVDPEDVEKILQRTRTALVSIMHSNNEVGTLQPIAEIGKLAHKYSAIMHTDVAQSLGKIPVDVDQLQVDLLTIAGHKLYAPKGVGALYIRDGIGIEPLIHGAGHENGRRAGTENVPYMVALGTACQIAKDSFPEVTEKLRQLRDRLWHGLRQTFGDAVTLHGHPTECLPNTLNVGFRDHIGSEILQKLPGIAASTGSACHEGKVTCSAVLRAMAVPENSAAGAVRLSVGRFSTEGEMDQAIATFASLATVATT